MRWNGMFLSIYWLLFMHKTVCGMTRMNQHGQTHDVRELALGAVLPWYCSTPGWSWSHEGPPEQKEEGDGGRTFREVYDESIALMCGAISSGTRSLVPPVTAVNLFTTALRFSFPPPPSGRTKSKPWSKMTTHKTNLVWSNKHPEEVSMAQEGE